MIIRSIIILILMISTSFASLKETDESLSRRLQWENKQKADDFSDITMYWLTGLPFAYSLMHRENGWHNMKLTGVVTGSNIVITQITKFAVGRERPDGSNHKSFPSGHASMAMTGALLMCKFEKKTCVYTLTAAGMTSYLRVAAGRHFLGDVFGGMTVAYLNHTFIPMLVFKL